MIQVNSNRPDQKITCVELLFNLSDPPILPLYINTSEVKFHQIYNMGLSSSIILTTRFTETKLKWNKWNHTVVFAWRRDWRCWCRSWRIETPSSSVSIIVLLLSLTLSVDVFNLSVDIISLALWSADTYPLPLWVIKHHYYQDKETDKTPYVVFFIWKSHCCWSSSLEV